MKNERPPEQSIIFVGPEDDEREAGRIEWRAHRWSLQDIVQMTRASRSFESLFDGGEGDFRRRILEDAAGRFPSFLGFSSEDLLRFHQSIREASFADEAKTLRMPVSAEDARAFYIEAIRLARKERQEMDR